MSKYNHAGGCLELKMTDDVVCLQFKTESAQVGEFLQNPAALASPILRLCFFPGHEAYGEVCEQPNASHGQQGAPLEP